MLVVSEWLNTVSAGMPVPVHYNWVILTQPLYTHISKNNLDFYQTSNHLISLYETNQITLNSLKVFQFKYC